MEVVGKLARVVQLVDQEDGWNRYRGYKFIGEL